VPPFLSITDKSRSAGEERTRFFPQFVWVPQAPSLTDDVSGVKQGAAFELPFCILAAMQSARHSVLE